MKNYFERIFLFIVCVIIFKCFLFIVRFFSKYRKWKLFVLKKKEKKLICLIFNSLEWSYDKVMFKVFDI